jgi:hypothetical protein
MSGKFKAELFWTFEVLYYTLLQLPPLKFIVSVDSGIEH